MNLQELLSQFFSAFTENSLYYFLFASPLFFLFWVVGKKQFQRFRIQPQQRATSQHFRHDIMHSISSMLVFAALDVLLIYLDNRGYTLLYTRVEDYGWTWTLLSFPILLFMVDAFFYWSHRMMHHPRLYPFFHRVHHQSTDPSPFTAFAFQPTEAIVEYTMGFVLPFVMPMHLGVILVWQLYDMLNNVMGHLGYELYPQGWVRWPILRYKTTSVHHNMHHEQFHGNYGLYFTWWDRWMGTEFPDYEARFDAIFQGAPKNSVFAGHPEASKEEIIQPHNLQSSTAQPIEETSANGSLVKVELNGQPYTFTTELGQTVLASALQQAVPLPHACKRGLCGTCKLLCTNGKVQMAQHSALTDAELESGFILTCQSVPVSKELNLRMPNTCKG